MFKKILIANRGEIACRIMRTTRRMGIKSVAVYSEADRDALHVEMADEAVPIGPAASAQSYLVAERIVQAARDTGAEAVHPGYGFLSEKAPFAEALAAAGIVFIGPPPAAMAALGDKIASKKLAQKAGVSTVPVHLGVIRDADQAVEIARAVGYPVMLKASAGGGGKGMRIAHSDAETREGFRLASSEARSSFADDRVFVEKYIEEPRHIEIQVLADNHGTTLYLGERECSIQRRHQKVIEEAPSPFIDEATRVAMGEQAVALARAVGYRSAGTVEFIVDRNRNFYFLEVNTRLQVEHPVTERVTGLDLVELMLRVAAGEKLRLTQADVALKGWSMEARVYAEDPLRGFLPSVGRLIRYAEPKHDAHVRVDSGVVEGDEISIYYDPMIAKLIVTDTTRDAAIAQLRRALDAFHVRGVRHNIGFLAALAGHPRFAQGRLSTDFIAEEYPDGFTGATLTAAERRRLVWTAAAIHRRRVERAAGISGKLPGHKRFPPDHWTVSLDGHLEEVTVVSVEGGFQVVGGGETNLVETDWDLGEPLFRGAVDGVPFVVQVDREGIGYRLFHAGREVRALVLTPLGARLHALMPEKAAADLSSFLLSPMPGLLVSLAVAVGQEVKVGEELAVVEAMKMENVLRAERDGVIKQLHAAAGYSLAVDQAILEFE